MLTPTELAAEYFRAWLAGDADALRAVLAPHATFRGPLGSAQDRESCVGGLLGMRAEIVTDLVVRARVASHAAVMTWFELHSEVAPPTPTVNWSRVRGGLIDRIEVVFDPRELLTGLQARGDSGQGAP